MVTLTRKCACFRLMAVKKLEVTVSGFMLHSWESLVFINIKKSDVDDYCMICIVNRYLSQKLRCSFSLK